MQVTGTDVFSEQQGEPPRGPAHGLGISWTGWVGTGSGFLLNPGVRVLGYLISLMGWPQAEATVTLLY